MTKSPNFSCSGLLLLSFALQAQDMVQIPAGEFTMGRTKLSPDDTATKGGMGGVDDRPDHKVYLEACQRDKTEATRRQYEEFAKSTKRETPEH